MPPGSGTMAPVTTTDSGFSSDESGALADGEGSPRPPTRVPGVWGQMPLAVRVFMIVLLVAAAGGIAVLSRTSLQSNSDLDHGTVQLLIPSDGSNILQQDQIGIDLTPGYSARLAVNGTALPAHQVRVVSYANQVQYTFEPGPGQVFTRWPAGQSCVIATYWLTKEGPSHSSLQHWCFTVV
jgi:hypothetical protein